MNYCKKSNQEKFIKYWNNEILKKLIRCSKEFGFHRNLKATLGADGSTKRVEFMDFILKHITKDIEKNKRYIISFYEVLHDDKLQYPLCAAKYSKVHLAHLFTLEVLNHCKISHSTKVDAFTWMTNETFKKDCGIFSFLGELRIYFKLLVQ